MIASQASFSVTGMQTTGHPSCNAWVTVSQCCTVCQEQVLTIATLVLPVETVRAQAVVAAAMRVDCGRQFVTLFLLWMATSGRKGHL